MPLRCTRKAPLLLALLLSACSFPALAQTSDATLRVRLEPRSSNAVAPRLGIDGTATAGCVPSVRRVTLDGADISIELTTPSTGCKAQRPAPFHLQADPAAAAGLRVLPPRVYRVRIYTGSPTDIRLASFSLIDTSALQLASSPESGFWWSQAGADSGQPAGTGMSLEVQDNQLAVSLLGFSDVGNSTWYFGSATLTGSTARVPLVQLANGDEWFSAIGTRPDVQPGPRLEIEFLSPTRARGWLVRGENGRDSQVRPLTLSRSAFSTGPAGSAWVGRWVLVPEDGGSARTFDFTGPSNRDADSFRLADPANDASLDCRLAAGSLQADVCTLSASALTPIDFDRVGFDHLSGHDANGAAVQLLRVPR